jgi:hypothetical protein
MSGGALLVYLSAGDFLRDGRRKFNAALPSDSDAVSNIEKSWDLSGLMGGWLARPQTIPRVVVGVHGKPSHRFIVGALEIDRQRIGDIGNRRFADQWTRPRWRVPLVDQRELDVAALRGRRVSDIQFGRFSHQLHIWVDGNGRRRH